VKRNGESAFSPSVETRNHHLYLDIYIIKGDYHSVKQNVKEIDEIMNNLHIHNFNENSTQTSTCQNMMTHCIVSCHSNRGECCTHSCRQKPICTCVRYGALAASRRTYTASTRTSGCRSGNANYLGRT